MNTKVNIAELNLKIRLWLPQELSVPELNTESL